MSVLALEIVERTKHPNADSLNIYQLQHPNGEVTQVIGNNDRIYDPGEVVAVAVPGAVLRDGTSIKRCRLRGVDSFGMILEKVTVESGTDLTTDKYVQVEMEFSDDTLEIPKTPHIKWPKIPQFQKAHQQIVQQMEISGSDLTIIYRGKIKLDGTNSSVQIHEGGLVPQSRNRNLSVENDNHSFARWVTLRQKFFQSLPTGIVVFGEWCGQGVQSRSEISKHNQKIFCVFGIVSQSPDGVTRTLVDEPEEIQEILGDLPEDVFVLPWLTPEFDVHFGDPQHVNYVLKQINTWIDEVAKEDPWAKEVLGLEASGEGVVFYPRPSSYSQFEWAGFKAVSEKTRTRKQPKAAQLSTEQLSSLDDFVETFVTEARLEQGVREACQGVIDTQLMGPFLKWFSNDVKSESQDEMDSLTETLGIAPKMVMRVIMNKARTWFLGKVKL